MKNEFQTTEQQGEKFVVDDALVEDLVDSFLEPYRDISNLYAAFPERRREILAKLEVKMLESVQTVLTMVYQVNAKMSAISDLKNYMADAAKRSLPQEGVEGGHIEQIERIRAEVSAKMADFHQDKSGEELPAHFDDWCKATVDEVVRIIKQTIGGVN